MKKFALSLVLGLGVFATSYAEAKLNACAGSAAFIRNNGGGCEWVSVNGSSISGFYACGTGGVISFTMTAHKDGSCSAASYD